MHLLLLAAAFAGVTFQPPAPSPPPAVLTQAPAAVTACVDAGFMWLADPAFFEATKVAHEGGTAPAWRILDRLPTATGYLLLFPKDCRLVVVAETETSVVVLPSRHRDLTDGERENLEDWTRLDLTGL